jgi:murein DD-endopeptidase MepM/ murein hydrolase activator NlpD
MSNAKRFLLDVRRTVLLVGVIVLSVLPVTVHAKEQQAAATLAASTPGPALAPAPFEDAHGRPVALPGVTPIAKAAKAPRRRAVIAVAGYAAAHRGPLPFVWPVHGWVTQRFGRIARGRFHHGIDIACAPGTTIRASRGGRALLQGVNTVYGNIVVLGNPRGFTELYAHMMKVFVRPGRWVHQGQRVGLCGSTGHSTGPHLHFEIRWRGRFINPRRYLP